MRQALPIIAKDLRRLRWALVLWGLLIFLRTVFYASISGMMGEPAMHWVNLFRPQGGIDLWMLAIDGLIAYLLVASIVFEDSPTVRDAFWVTRPQSGTMLFAAKLVTAFIVAVGVPFLAHLPWWMACDMPIGSIASMGMVFLLSYGAVALLALAVATMTDGFPRLVLWTIMGLATMFGVMMVSRWIASAFSIDVRPGDYPVWLLFVGFALVAVPPAAHQYRTRRLVPSIAWLAVGTTVFMTVFMMFPPGGRSPHMLSWQDIKLTRDASLTLELPHPVEYVDSVQRLRLVAGVTDARDNEMVWAQLRWKWVWPDGSEWNSRNSTWLVSSRTAVERMYTPDPANRTESFASSEVHFPRVRAEKARENPPRLVLSGEVVSVIGREDASMTPRADAAAEGRAGGYRIASVQRRGREVEVECVAYKGPGEGKRSGRDLLEYALVNRASGRCSVGRKAESTAVLGLVRVVVSQLQFQIPNDESWLDGAEFVAVAFNEQWFSRSELTVPAFQFETAPRSNGRSFSRDRR